jgi:hypothetical protein
MRSSPRVLKRLILMLAVSLSMLATVAVSAQASTAYGELERFGEAGEELGKVNNAEPAIGVDPTENSVFVVDELSGYSFLRIQKFSKVEGKYKEVASREFVPPDASGNEELGSVRGVAVDPTLGRVYVLSVQARSKKKKAIEGETEAASALYAFKTSNLESAVTGESEGILAGPSTLLSESQALGAGGALLEPSGIAVDPENKDVLILGAEVRESEAKQDVRTIALQQVTSAGALGSRWEDVRKAENPETHKQEESSYFEEQETCAGCSASSPVVTSTGNIYVRTHVTEENVLKAAEIVEIPKGFKAVEAPVEKYRDPVTDSLFGLVQGPAAAWGGALSIGPAKEGSEQRIYAAARVGNGSELDTLEEGALVLNGAAEEIGYAGGGSLNSAQGACDLQQGKNNSQTDEWPVFAAGGEETLFVLGREQEQINPENYPLPKLHIVEFGPGGHSCPTTEVTEPTVEAGGEKGLSQVAINEKVNLESALVQPNAAEAPDAQAEALSVEWNFGDGTTETIKTRQGTISVAQHAFKQAGELTITEKVHTNDLASPLVEAKRRITVVGAPAVVTGEGQVNGTSVTLTGTVNTFGPKAKSCEFKYGTTIAYGKTAKCEPTPEGEEAEEVKAHLSSLAPSTTYHFELVAESTLGVGTGRDATFTTAANAPVPAATTEPASAVSETGATLNAKVDPEGSNVTKCEFQYGSNYEMHKACALLPGSGTTAVAVSVVVGGLSANTTYSYRVLAENAGGSKIGSGVQFTTLSPPVCTVNCGGEQKTEPTPTPTMPPPPPLPPVIPLPAVTLAAGVAPVASSGSFGVKASCPVGTTSCSGTISVQTVSAVLASVGAESAKAKRKAAILVLASGTFTLSAGQSKLVGLHLTSKGRALIARLHAVRVRVTVVAHDPAGGTHTTIATLTLHLVSHKRH